VLRAAFDDLEQAGALRPGITAALATSALRAALRGVAHAVAANPDSDDNDAMSAVVRDALIRRSSRTAHLTDASPAAQDRARTCTKEQRR
jgi:hypothetical protein